MTLIERSWHRFTPLTILLLPLSACFALIVFLRRSLYRFNFLKRYKASVPLIVVGNISVGGNGKTPFVLALTAYLQKNNYRPGIVLRGYGARCKQFPKIVTDNDTAVDVGDEALLLAKRSGVPVAIAPKRPEAVDALIEQGCNVIISDDGLQHYALQRDIEIVVVDNERQFGNRLLLPAGPLRESKARLKTVDFIIMNGGDAASESSMQLSPGQAINLKTQAEKPLDEFITESCHAIAGIGHPKRFFNLLRAHDIKIEAHAFPDHHPFSKQDISFSDNKAVLMTEKDAVKCLSFANENCWAVPVTATLSETMLAKCLVRLQSITQ